MKNISIIIYALVAILLGWYFYQYTEYSVYIGGIALSFVLCNALVLYFYQGLKNSSMALMKFMGINFLKDILWAVLWMFLIQGNAVLSILLACIFLFLSIPLYISVLKRNGGNEKSDKNQH